MSNNPYQQPQDPGAAPPRRRRSQRARQDDAVYGATGRPSYPPDEDRAPLPLGSEPQQPPRERPQVYDYEAAPRPAYDGGYDDDDYNDGPRLWPRILLLIVVLLLLASAALYFLVPKDNTGLLGQARGGIVSVVDGVRGLVGLKEEEAPKLIKFESPVELASTGMKTVFTLTADRPIDGVRVIDDQGSEIRGQLSAASPDNSVWMLTVVFDQPLSSLLRAEMLVGQTWHMGDKTLSFVVAEPSPTSTLVPTDAPALMPGFDPGATQPPVDQPDAGEAGDQSLSLDILNGLAAQAPQPSQPPATTVVTDAPTPTTSPAPVIVITIAPQLPVQAASVQEPQDIAAQPQDDEAMDIADLLGDGSEWESDGGFELPLDIGDEEPYTDVAGNAPAAETGDMVVDDVLPDEPIVTEATTEPVVQTPATPAPSPMPQLVAEADEGSTPKKLGLQETVYQKARKQAELKRDMPLNMPAPHEYATYEGGVFTFRGDGFRGNAASGAPEMPLEQLSLLWKAPLGSLRTADGTLYGIGWTGQPAIIRWSKELREWMNIQPAKKDVTALKEVIVASLDGKIYFFDLNDGVATREPIDLGLPLKGSVTVDPRGQPLLAVGQGMSKMPSGTKPIGYYLYELIGQKQLYFLNGRKTKNQTQFSTNGAFDGTALFERNSDNLVLAGENGLLYTLKLNTKFDFLDTRTLKIDPEVTYLKSKAKQPDMSVASEASVAMYGKYIYTVDRQGILRCVDSDTMKAVWAFDTGDNTDATPALGFDPDGSLGLYTGTTVFTRLRNKGTALIRRLDALTGKEVWKVEVPAKYEATERGGVKASPVVGEGAAEDLVFFTVNMTGDGKTATLLALRKSDGSEAWRYELANRAISSPVAVYSKAGQAYILQADEAGLLSLLRAQDGELLHSLELGARIEASPAVYSDVLVIGSSDKDNNFLFGVRLE